MVLRSVVPLLLVLLVACAPKVKTAQDPTAQPGTAATATATGGATPVAAAGTVAPAAPQGAGAPDVVSASSGCGNDATLLKDLAAADAVALSSASNGSSGDLCLEGASATCVAEYLIFLKTNAVRALHDLTPLSFSAKISVIARDWSSQQAETNKLSHDGWPEARETAFGEKFHGVLRTNAENVAMEPTTSVSDMAAQAVDAWICSSGHRENILGKSADLGIGIACNSSVCYATQIFGYD